jgi:nitroreductase
VVALINPYTGVLLMSAKPAPTEVPIHDLLAGRWSPRAYLPDAVSATQIHGLLEAARWAPSSYNFQPWRFLVADKHTDQAAYDKVFASLVPFNQGWNKNTPLLIAACAQTMTPKGEPNHTAGFDTGAAVMSLVLQAHALGLAGHQMSGFDRDALRASFSLPAEVEPFSIIAIGHPGPASMLEGELQARETSERSRIPLAEMAFFGAWGKGK